jgi:hypothetical protein
MDKVKRTNLRPRLRFGLRTLFVLFTAIAIWLGMRVQRARVQEAAVAAIERAGATVRYDYQFDSAGNLQPNAEQWAPEWLRNVFGEHFFKRAYGVYLCGSDGIANRTAMPPLMISVERQHVAPELINAISRLGCLKEIELLTTDLTDRELAQLFPGSQLRRLRLDGNAITDATVNHLASMKRLHYIDLRHTQLSDAAISSLRQKLPEADVYCESEIEIPIAYWTTQHGSFSKP